MRQNQMPGLQFNAKHRIRQRFLNDTFHLYGLFLQKQISLLILLIDQKCVGFGFTRRFPMPKAGNLAFGASFKATKAEFGRGWSAAAQPARIQERTEHHESRPNGHLVNA